MSLDEWSERFVEKCPLIKTAEILKKACLVVGNKSTLIIHILLTEGPQHFYQLVDKANASRSTIHRALVNLKQLELIYVGNDDLWRLNV